MENKVTKDTTKEDHYVEIAVGFKIIYNQNQYLAYTEVPKKKKDVRLEIYIGRVSFLKDQYLLFKCETDSERRQVFSYFKQVFSGEVNNEIEIVDFSMIERMSIVSSDVFEEKMDQYPNFFTLPKKEEEISANITLPSFLMKKTSKIKDQPEEIQFVGDSDEVLESNVEAPANTEIEQAIQMPTTQQANQANIAESSPVETTMNPSTTPAIPDNTNNVQAEVPFMENPSTLTTTPTVQPIVVNNIDSSTVQTPNLTETINQNVELQQSRNNVELPVEQPVPNMANEIQSNIQVPVMQQAVSNEIVPPVAPALNNQNIGVSPVQPSLNPEPIVEQPVKFEQINGKKEKTKKEKKKGKTSIIVLMIITLLLIASVAVVYVFVLEPKMNEQTNKPNNPPIKEPETPKTSELVCTIEINGDDNSLENKTITFVYDNTSKNILSSKEHTIVTMPDEDIYMERKAMIKVFSQELKNTDGQKYTFKYDDKKYIYEVFIERDYEKALDTEKDETWKYTYDEANEYYLGEGYTCNGIKKEPSNEKKLTSTTRSNTVDYNNWVVTYQKAVLSEDKATLSVTLEVKNNGSEMRTLNGELKLFDKDNQNVRKIKLNQQIAAGETSMIVLEIKSENESKNPELGILETIDFENITQYLIELYR